MSSMRDDFRFPDFTFPTLVYGKLETPLDLTVLLYRGGAKARADLVSSMISRGELGSPIPERLELIVRIHDVINGRLEGGGRPTTASSTVDRFRYLFAWADEANHQLTIESVQAVYLGWADSLLHRHRILRSINENTAYQSAAMVGSVLDDVLDRSTPILKLTRLRSSSQRKTARGISSEKQNLQNTIEFGYLLQDICDGLSLSVVLMGTLPIRIFLRSGSELLVKSGLRSEETLKRYSQHTPQIRQTIKKRNERRVAQVGEGSLGQRYSVVNIRIVAELLMFIGQTSMNLAQAHQEKLRNFCYASHLDGYQVKDRKYRKGGQVLFEIYKDYKPHFERYLAWRKELFPDADLLFPFVRQKGRAEHSAPSFHKIRDISKEAGVSFVPPSALRNTRVNWLLRRSGDVELTAEMSQHATETLLGVYERPSQQRAMGEVMRFWATHDPALATTIPIAPGECDGQPVPMPNIPKGAPQPDCIQVSGCLWCTHHRDIDRQDYVWSLSCFRHLKIIELSRWHAPQGEQEIHPAEHAITRLSDKLRWFHESNELRRSWVEEALARVEEGSYHPDWQRLIDDMEGAS